MNITESEFGELPGGQLIHEYTLSNKNSIEIKVISYGGIITSVRTPDADGNVDNIVLGFDNLESYTQPHPFFGALIGRYGNRIAKGRFTLAGREYQLSINDGENHLHGGEKGFDKVVWDSKIENGRALTLSYLSPDGEQGYPGNLHVTVSFELTDDNELSLHYHAVTDADTPVNLTSHSYFNLTGNPSRTILHHQLKLFSDSYTPVNDQLIPTGAIEPVAGTPFNFTDFKKINKQIGQVDGGYDHNFISKNHNDKDDELKTIARVLEPDSRRELTVLSTEPGFQFYSGNFLDGSFTSPDGVPFEKYSGFCIEPQHFPNSPNEHSFPSTILKPGESYNSTTIYRFGLIEGEP